MVALLWLGLSHAGVGGWILFAGQVLTGLGELEGPRCARTESLLALPPRAHAGHLGRERGAELAPLDGSRARGKARRAV